MLRRLRNSLCIILVINASVFGFSCTSKNKAAQNSVISFIGSVEITRGTDAARSIVLGEELKEGDRIKTGKASFMVFRIGETATARIQPDSDVTLANISDPANINLGLAQGGILNKVMKLPKGGGYRVQTPTVVASVRGTVFSAYYEKGTNTVAVKNGNVEVAVKDSNEIVMVKAGNAVVYTGGLAERPIDEIENIVMDNMISLPEVINLDDQVEAEKVNRQIIEKDKEVNRQIEEKSIPKTLDEIKAKYERIDEVVLYSGKVIRGVIVERGAYYKILTTSGYVSIAAKQVRNTKVIK